jgi:hyperosmotically inducible periplasmic protein
MKRHLRTIACAAILAAPMVPLAAAGQSTSTAADNTKMNKGDKSTNSPTADRAKNNLSDREVMAHIRRDVVKDKTLSMNAHNVKIMSMNGKVVLRGPVNSEQEKQTVEQYAKKYAGDMNVTNEISVKADSK